MWVEDRPYGCPYVQTCMRCGMNSLALRMQQALRRDPHAGDLYVFRGKSGKLIRIFWHDGLGASPSVVLIETYWAASNALMHEPAAMAGLGLPVCKAFSKASSTKPTCAVRDARQTTIR